MNGTVLNFVVAVRGTVPSVRIALPENPSETQRYAADELRNYIAKTTGVTLPVEVGEGRADGCIRFMTVADAAIGNEGFRIACDGLSVTISASAKGGALYGAYEFLERFCGCRWYASWCEKTPQLDRIEVPAGFEIVQKPDFEMRGVHWSDVLSDGDFAARLRVNANAPLKEKHGGEPCRFGRGVWACHTFKTLLPHTEFFMDHPEYFGERDGKRSGGNQPCLTNPDVLRIVTERLKEHIRRDPDAKFYGVSQNDHVNYCQCEKCRAIDEEEESTAGSTMRFVNAVAEEIEKEFPDKLVETLAYQYSRFPTKKTKLRKNVVPCVCSIECDFRKPLSESTDGMNKIFADCLRGWSEQTEQLYVWDYTVDFKDYLHFFPNFRVLQSNVRFFRASKVRYLFEQGGATHAFMAELKAWLLAKWEWNADLPMEELVDDFLNGYYGKGAPFIREFLRRLEAENDAWAAAHPDYTLWIYEEVTDKLYSDEFIDWAYAQWKAAEKATEDDPVAHRNVRMSALSAVFERYIRHDTPECAAEFDALVKEVGNVRYSEGSPRDRTYSLDLEKRLPGAKEWEIPGWDMVWHDEFDGNSLDGSSWNFEKGFVRNNELQYYTRWRKENCRVENSCLVLEARKEKYVDPETGAEADYTSASLESSWRYSLMYGRVDVRAKVPAGLGLWPAAWMLGANIDEVGWPHCGEIDIMEYVGHEPNTAWGTIHWSDKRSEKPNRHMSLGAKKVFDKPLSDDFHVFSVEWDEKKVAISVDGEKYFEADTTTFDPATPSWPPFNQYHYFILNLAYGGVWGGAHGVDDSCLPARYLVDWIRVYKKK